jgi:hypothetical protein
MFILIFIGLVLLEFSEIAASAQPVATATATATQAT